MVKKHFLIVLIILYLQVNISFTEGYKTIIDLEGRKVSIPRNLKRVVVLTAVCIEAVYFCGEIDKVVGINRFKGNPVYFELIKELKDIPVVAETEQDVNIERLLSVKPQMVIGLGGYPFHSTGLKQDTIDRIESFGIPVILINVRSLKDNYKTIKLIGQIFNKERKTEEVVNYLKGIERKVKNEVKKVSEDRKVKVLFVSGENVTMVGGGYWGKNDIKVLAGGINVAEEIKEFFAIVSLEKIISWNPDVILISHAAKYSPEDLFKNPQLKDINAIKNKRVYKNPYQIGGLYTPRVVLLFAWTAKKLYPALSIDWVKIVDDFFKKFYRTPYYGPKE